MLLSLQNRKMDNPLILQLLQKLHHLSCANKTIHLCWIPSHIGIRGNEAADMATKESLDQNITVSQVPYTDLKSHINFFISSKWHERWSSCRDNKLLQIKPTLGSFVTAKNWPYLFFPLIYFTSGRSFWMHSMSGDLLCQTRLNRLYWFRAYTATLL